MTWCEDLWGLDASGFAAGSGVFSTGLGATSGVFSTVLGSCLGASDSGFFSTGLGSCLGALDSGFFSTGFNSCLESCLDASGGETWADDGIGCTDFDEDADLTGGGGATIGFCGAG